MDTLRDLHETLTITQAITYCNTRRKVDRLAEQMGKRDFIISTMHAELDQKERDLITREFWSGSSRVLISADFLARHIVVQQVSFVIDYVLPGNLENHHWDDRNKITIQDIGNTQYLARMNPTAGSFIINPRLQRHFWTCAVPFPEQGAFQQIYSTLAKRHFER